MEPTKGKFGKKGEGWKRRKGKGTKKGKGKGGSKARKRKSIWSDRVEEEKEVIKREDILEKRN